MAGSKRNLKSTKFYRYWFGERMGSVSRAARLGQWLVLAPVWKFLVKKSGAFFSFTPPAWSRNLHTYVYKKNASLRWHDYINPIYWMVWSVSLFYQWIISRPYLTLGPAIPAVVLAIAVFAAFFQNQFERVDWRSDYYRRVLSTAAAKEDVDLARIALLNLISRNPSQATYRMQQALLDEKLGNSDSAVRTMLQLVNQQRHPQAALWVLQKQYDVTTVKNWEESKRQAFQGLMQIALDGLKGSQETDARTLMANYLIGIGAPGAAAQNMAQAAKQNKELMLPTAALYSQLQDNSNTRYWAEQARGYYDDVLLTNASDNSARLNLARCLLLLAREQEAAQTLSEGYRLTNDKTLLDAGAEALVALAIRIQRSEGDTPTALLQRLGYIKKATEISPTSQLAVEALVQITIECAENKNKQIAALRSAMLQGVSTDTAHFVEGTVALFDNRLEEAERHFGLISSDQRFPGLMNNMAVMLSQRNEPDLDRALGLSNQALKSLPDNAYLRETRGQILFKLGRFKDAIPDLEFALQATEIRIPVHASLATAYAELGDKVLSEQHQRIHDQMVAASKK